MLGQSALTSAGRVFVYEVKGLRQSETNDNNAYQFRSSDSILIKVPYARMNEEMQRINRMGGTIVSIRSVDASSDE